VALLDIRRHAGYLFLAAIVGHVVLISAQVPAESGAPILEVAAFGALAEVQRGADALLSGTRRVWNAYVSLRQVHEDNERLRRELARARVELQEQRARADRSRSLQQLLDLRDRLSLSTAAAEIIAAGATSEFRTITIDKGSADGLQADMAVIAPSGVVGRIVLAAGRASKVQLIVDRNAAAGGLIERTRAQGVVMGMGEGRLRMEYVSDVADVSVGDLVVTSGIDRIYPKGFVIGTVTRVEKSGPAYRSIDVKAAVDFFRLEEVLVVLTPTPGAEAESELPR
jgi:rod shape-determining protein MreC